MIRAPFGWLRGPGLGSPRIGANFAQFGLSPVTSHAAAATTLRADATGFDSP